MSPNGRICSTFLFSILFSFPHENSYFPALFYISLSLFFFIYFQPYIDLLTGNTFDSRYSFFFLALDWKYLRRAQILMAARGNFPVGSR